jgi:hypothetical protein
MSQEQNYYNLSYDELLNVARGSAKVLIPKLCAALKRENPNYSNYDIREIVMKDCIQIWKKATIRDALPKEYKEKTKQKAGIMGNEAKYGSGQAAEFDNSGESDNNLQDSNPAESGSSSQTGTYSEDFDKVNGGPDIMTQTERFEKLEKRINEQEVELNIVKNEDRLLKEKSLPDVYIEMHDQFYDEPGIIDAKKLRKISFDSGKNIRIMLERYNGIIQDAIDAGQPVPVGTYVVTKPDMKLVPIRIPVDFEKRTVRVSLWEKKLTID